MAHSPFVLFGFDTLDERKRIKRAMFAREATSNMPNVSFQSKIGEQKIKAKVRALEEEKERTAIPKFA